jgi:Fe-S-cluster-containing dehydrogenase component/anaerobic selenocysteine-containing dehydrogenase
MDDPSSKPLARRTFLKLAGGLGVAAGCSPRAATQKVIPFVVPPEDIVPGTPLYYRTACRECPAGCGVTARTREGRAVKLEGNPEDPIGRGALCARGQAALQALYHPERFRGPMRRQAGALATCTWDEAEDVLARGLEAARARGPGRVRLVTRAEPGSAGVVQRAFLAAVGARPQDRVVLEPLDPAPLREAGRLLFARAELPAYDLAEARSVVAFGADFLETWLSPVELARGLAAGRARGGDDPLPSPASRSDGDPGTSRTRVTWVGPRLSLTGVSADRWLRTRAGGELAVALGLLRELLSPRAGLADVPPELKALRSALEAIPAGELSAQAGVPYSEIGALARELAHRRPSALLGPGPASQGPEATRLAAVLLLVNLVLGNLGRTVRYGQDPLVDPPSPAAEVDALLADAAAGAVDVLLVHHADLVGTLPAALRAGQALGKIRLVATFALRPDATTAHAHLVLPDHHTLEALGDVTPRRGVIALAQPVMVPLHDTRPASQVLLETGRRLPGGADALPWSDFAAFVRERDAERARPVAGSAGSSSREAFQRGGRYDAAPAPAAVTLARGALSGLTALPRSVPPAAAGELDLVLFPTALRGDGRGADLPWLREIPDALSTVSWTPWAELSPAAAARLGVAQGDLVSLETASGRAELPVYVFPGLRDDAIAIPLGGPEALAVAPGSRDPGGARVFASARARVARVPSRPRPLPILEGSPYQHGREIVPVAAASGAPLSRPDLSQRLYPEPAHPEHRWAMAIDLDRCTGCEACVVACFAENNVPVMGPEAAVLGRYMGWLRIERYLGDEPGGDLDVRLLPMMCQQCTNAPCEPVCPVFATYHTAEGLSAQIYNRCVGTRYCSNNCPYKTRTFNWRDARFERPLDMQLNPDVTVRSRGVMEKCTFCVQRIRYAEGQARGEGRPVADGEILPACAQTCPTQAITFGDANDPTSLVSRLARGPRGFRALEELGTQPAVTYLARVRAEEKP